MLLRKASALIGGCLMLAAMAQGASAQTSHHGPGHAATPAGQEARTIASLSAEEIAGYVEGRGQGFARPADLNGYPGPTHVLEHASELSLSPEQRLAVEAIRTRMKQAAQAAGARYLASERAVDDAFRTGDTGRIEALVQQAAAARAEVRLSHLSAHVETASLLTTEQRQRYLELRGYGTAQAGGRKH